MKNKIKYIVSVIILLTVLFLTSCNTKHEEGDGHDHSKLEETQSEEDGHDHGSHKETHNDDDEHDHGANEGSHMEEDEHSNHGEEDEIIHLTAKQIEAIGLELGGFSTLKVNDFIKSTGVIGLPPNGYSAVSVKAEGIVEDTRKYVEGDYIKKGQLIAYLSNTSFLIKQQEFLESKANLQLKEFNLTRQQELVNADAGVSKSLQSAQAEVNVLKAKTQSLSKQLQYLGISTSNLSPNSLSERIPIRAPMSGYISSINMHNGMYAIPSNPIMEIISSDHLHLELDVFEKDISVIKVGQKISYTVPALGNKIYTGEISVIGKEFNIETKTVRIHGHLEGEKPTFLKDLFINAKIWLNDNDSKAVPENAIIRDGNDTFIYAANKEEKETEFTKIRVITGATSNGFTAVRLLEIIPEGMKIVTKGAYYVNAQSKAGELEHEH